MIQASELRIGNYVQDVVSGEWMIVDELGENIGATIINRDKYPLPDGWQMGLIPLTPEILSKAGFDKDGYLLSELEKEQYVQYIQGELILHGPDSATSGQCYTVKCEYLHHMQNLIFDLTGEELKINL